MNINDPFGRIQDRRQRDYESLRLSLQEVGLTTRADGQALLKRLRRRAARGLAIIVPVTLLLALGLPELRVLILACGVLAVIWLGKTSWSSHQYVERYIREELADQGDSSS